MPQVKAGNRCVLLLGWKAEYANVLKEHGIEAVVVATRGDLENLRTGYGDTEPIVCPVSDLSNVEEVLSALYLTRHSHRITDVHTNREFAQTTAALIGEHLGIPHVPVSTVLGARDKRIQKSRIRSAGFPVANVTSIGRLWEIDWDTVAAFEYPGVLKPAAGSGAFMTRLVKSADEVKACISAYSALGGESPDLILESAIFASESVANGLVREGKIRHLSFVRYSVPVMSGSLTPERACVAVDPADEITYRKAQALCEGMVEALQFRNTTFHMECFEREGELIFSEVGSRAPGCGMTPLTKAKFGLDFAKEGLLAALCLPEGGNWVTSPFQMATLDFPAAPGVVVRAPSTDDLLRKDGVIDGSIDVKVGDVMRDMRTHSSWKAGSAVVQGADHDQLWERAASLFSWIRESVDCLPVPGIRPY